MENLPAPTLKEIEALLAYLPRLYAEGFTPITRWEGGQKSKDGSISMPYPVYDPLVEEFYRQISAGGWVDTRYDPGQAYEMLKDQSAVKSASLAQVRAMLTFCVRGERFSDGHWAEMIEQGR